MEGFVWWGYWFLVLATVVAILVLVALWSSGVIEIWGDGTVGSRGPQGFHGVGITGATGFVGPRGITGVAFTGPGGPTGEQGPTGAETIGSTGVTGAQGFPGEIGPDGNPGPTGPDGIGFSGDTGPDGNEGPQGAPSTSTGPTGPTGPSLIGHTGPTGFEVGPTGLLGPVGPFTSNYPTGATGFDTSKTTFQFNNNGQSLYNDPPRDSSVFLITEQTIQLQNDGFADDQTSIFAGYSIRSIKAGNLKRLGVRLLIPTGCPSTGAIDVGIWKAGCSGPAQPTPLNFHFEPPPAGTGAICMLDDTTSVAIADGERFALAFQNTGGFGCNAQIECAATVLLDAL